MKNLFNIVLNKRCPKCGETKSFGEFYDSKRRDGKHSLCKSCCCEYSKQYRLTHQSREYALVKRRRLKHAEEIKEYYNQKYKLLYKEADSYIIKLLCQNSTLFAKDIPPELIIAKRLQIQLHRKLKEIQS